MKMTLAEVRAEMARRKVQFHEREEWGTINLWGLFAWSDISAHLKSGRYVTDMHKENKTLWVRPVKAEWEGYIKPLIDTHTLTELSEMAGWSIS